MNTNATHYDPCLTHAIAQWHAPLAQGKAQMAQGNVKAALPLLGEAIRISASFHPLFHFLESGLNTELAILHLRGGKFAQAQTLFTRAVFLHHDNATALAGQQACAAQDATATLPPYGTLQLAAELAPAPSEGGVHAIHARAKKAAAPEAIPLYEKAITLLESVHPAYHREAAMPWLYRAECFAAQGEDLLARNDIRHGMDLDRENAGLLALSLQLAA